MVKGIIFEENRFTVDIKNNKSFVLSTFQFFSFFPKSFVLKIESKN